MENKRTPADTLTIMTQVVEPNDTNPLGNLHGGKVMYWMDICSAICAQKHCSSIVVTAAVDNVSFHQPINIGWIVTIEAKVTRTFNTSMEVYLKVWAESLIEKKKFKSNEAYYTFVALDKDGKPIKVDEIFPQTDEEKRHYDGALRRRQLRLILGGRMKVEEANELRRLFVPDEN